jgi:hypothetical protein
MISQVMNITKPSLAGGARLTAHVFAAAGVSRSLRDGHALCRPRITIAPSPAVAARGSAATLRPAANGCADSCASRARRNRRERAVPSTICDRPPQPSLAGGACLADHVCAAGGASRSLRDGHALCRQRVAAVLPSRRWWRVCARRPMCVPPAARRDRVGMSTGCAARASQQSFPAVAGGVSAPGCHVCAGSTKQFTGLH